MDISDEELFDSTRSCTLTTNVSLNLTKQTNDLMPDSIQNKDSNNIVTKNISVKLTRLSNTKIKKEPNLRSAKNKRKRYFWKFGVLKGKFYKRKGVSSFVSLKSWQQFQKMEPASEPSEDRKNKKIHTHLYDQLYEVGESSKGDQENEQTAQSEMKKLTLSTYQVLEEEEEEEEEEKEEEEEGEESYTEVYSCARTLPYGFYRESGRISNNKYRSSIEITTPSSLSSNSKNAEPSLHSNRSYLSDSLSSSNTNTTKRLSHSRLKFMTKSKQNKWKFKRKFVLSDNEVKEPVPRKRLRRMSSDESDIKNTSVSNAELIEDNNQSESHLSLEKIDEKKTDMQIDCTARVILTRLEEMENEDIIKWRKSKTKLSDGIASEPIEEQLDQQTLLSNLVTLESRDKLILSKEDKFLKTRNIPEDHPLTTSTSSCIVKHCKTRSKLNKLKKKYKLFKKPRVLLIQLDILQRFSKDGRYSASKIEHLTKKYMTFVINSNFQDKSRELRMYRYVRLQRKSTTDINDTIEDHNTSPNVSRRQSTDEIFNVHKFSEEPPIKDSQIIESDSYGLFKINRKFTPIQNQDKSLSPGTSEKKKLSQKRLEIWRNAFRVLISSEKSQKEIAAQSTSTLQLLSSPRKKSANAKYESTLPSTSMSSTKHDTPVESPRKFASPKKQTESSPKPIECNDTSKPESSVSSKKLSSDANVEKIIYKSNFTQSKDSTVSKSPHKNAKEVNTISNSSKKMSSKLHEKTTNLELSISDTPEKLKISEVRNVKQSHKKEQAYKCTVCDALFKNHEMLLKHTNLHKTCAVVNTSSNASKSVKISILDETIMNKKKNQNFENSKSLTLQEQCSSVNGEGGSQQLDKSVLDFDMEILSSSSSSSSKVIKTHCDQFKMSHKKTKAKSTTKSKSDLKLNSSNKTTNVKSKRAVTCKICLRVFANYAQLLKHMFKHMANDLRSMYTSIENEIAYTHQENSENNNQVSDDVGENSAEVAVEEVEVVKNGINEQDKRLSENINESNAENLITSKISQYDANKKTNKASNLLAAKCIVERDSQKQSTPVTSNAEKVQSAEKEKTCIAQSSSDHQSIKSLTICKCHRPRTNSVSPETNIQIEIVLMCTICQTLFRRFECFETHYSQHSAEGMLCNKNRRHSRKSKLLCVNCQKTLNSIQELWHHLVMHSRLNRTGTVTFCCNVCKVIFCGLGQLFTNHFQNHAKNSFFLASRLSFPRPSYIGSKLIKLPASDNDNNRSFESYMQVADYVCHDCRMPFISAQFLKSHKAVCPNITTTSVDPRSGFSDGRNSSGRTPILLICGFCNKTFYSRMSFEVHSLEHTQKRDVHLHYTCVSVTAITKVYICKVCTTMWRSLQSFEEHWQTHVALQEDYICSRCHNHYNSIDLLQRHAIVHKSNNEMQQMPITCEVIYRDIDNSSTNPQKDAAMDDLPYMNLSCFDNGKDFTKKTVNDKSHESQELTCSLEKLLLGNQSEQEVMMSSELSVDSKELRATRNTSQIPVQVPSPNVAVAQSRRNNGNSRNFDDSDEEDELTIVLSESEESSVSNGIRRNADSTPTKHQNTQENTKSTLSGSAVINEQCSNDADAAVASTKTSNDESGSVNSNTQVSTITSVDTQLNTNANHLKDNIDHLVSSDANSSRKEIRESLPKNMMSSVPKSFLRVKSLAELTTDFSSLEKHFCRVCGMSFESRPRLRGHMQLCVHNPSFRQGKQGGPAPLSDNVQVWPAKPTFNPLVTMPTTSTQDRLLPSIATIRNVSPSITVRPNTPSRIIDITKPRQHQVFGVKLLSSVKSNTIADVSKPKETPSHEVRPSLNNVSATPQHDSLKPTAYHKNLPSRISKPLKKSAQPVQQQQNPGTVAVRPFLQTTYATPRPPPPPYPQQSQQPPQVQQQPPEVQQQPPQVQQPSQVQQQLQQSQQQQPQHFQQPSQVQQQSPQLQQSQQQQPQHFQQPSQVQQPLQLQQQSQQQQPQHFQQPSQVQQPLQLQQQSQRQQPQHFQQPSQVQQPLQLQQQSQQQQPQHFQQPSQVQQQPSQLQPQHLQQLSQVQQPLQLRQQSQLRQQPQQQFQKQLQQPQPQQQLQQQQLQPQFQQQQSSQQQLQQQHSQQLQQQLQQSQQIQQLQQQQQAQFQQLQIQLQQQPLQQQQQMSINSNVVHYLISKTGVSYQLTTSNIVPTSSDNVMLVAVNTMQQISKNPDRYVCLHCPGFECSSVQEFTVHEHSPKHEARSHYNGVAYVPRT